METIVSPVAVPGWVELTEQHPTRALVLRALTDLELKFYCGDLAGMPTRRLILAEAIRLGAKLSVTSLQTAQRHLDALVESGHAVKLPTGKAPWRSRYLMLPPSGEVAQRGQDHEARPTLKE
jgi:hypothetical protein